MFFLSPDNVHMNNQLVRIMRRRIGRILFWIGVAIVGAVSFLGVFVISVSALVGSSVLVVSYSEFVVPVLAIGILAIVVGLITALLPDGLSKDGLSALKLGPYLR